jgi:hypothetical protein
MQGVESEIHLVSLNPRSQLAVMRQAAGQVEQSRLISFTGNSSIGVKNALIVIFIPRGTFVYMWACRGPHRSVPYQDSDLQAILTYFAVHNW